MDESSNIEQIARVCHEVNRAYCQSLGDISQPSWEKAPQWQRESAMTGVAAIVANPATTPEQSHEGWLEQKRAAGWTYGPVKDAEKKEHPCFVPYEQLPMEQRAKDYLFGAVVRTLAFEVPELVTSR
jgi:RyR domain-containing protein